MSDTDTTADVSPAEQSTVDESTADGSTTDESTTEQADEPEIVLEVNDLQKSFGGLVATDHATFEVERGTITGLIGPNGAGKSTIFNLISGFYESDGGTVMVNGTDVTNKEPYEVAEQGLIRTFQTPRKLEGMTVREAMLIGPRNQPGESFLTLFTDPDAVNEAESANLADAQRILEEFEIDHLATQPATDISGGQMKLVELARAMLAEPEILLLDEPVAGVNPTLRNTLAEQIRRLNEQGTTFLLIEHDMEFVMSLADPVVVLNQGSVLMEGTPDEIQTNDRVIEAYLGGGT
jgi:branched-chain amino acid transport system ATP-binding protein